MEHEKPEPAATGPEPAARDGSGLERLLRFEPSGRLAGSPSAGGRRALLLALQRSAGNASVNRLLRSLAPPVAGAVAAAPDAPRARALVVADDGPAPEPGQMRSGEFLDALKPAVCATAEAALSSWAFQVASCPWIEHWVEYYRDKDPADIERAVSRYAPAAAPATTAAGYIVAICARVREGIAAWEQTGELPSPPPDGPGVPPGERAPEAPVAFKLRNGARPDGVDPADLRRRLGPGRPLDVAVRARMAPAIRADLSGVRIHDDPATGRLARSMRARAFAVGEHIGFAPNEYEPGTPVGDALIAHELAHVVQQQAVPAPGASGWSAAGAPRALEADADRTAVAVVAGLHGAPLTLAREARPRLRSRLSVQRCSDSEMAREPERTRARPGTVAGAILLVRGAFDSATSDPPDTAGAEIVLAEIADWLEPIVSEDNISRYYAGRPTTHSIASIFASKAAGAIASFRRRLRYLEDPREARPLLKLDVDEFEVAQEFLEVLAGERGFDESMGPAIERAGYARSEILIGSIPVVGSLWMAGEAIVGRSFLSGERLSTLERVLLGGGALLAEMGPLVAAGKAVPLARQLRLVSRASAFKPISRLEAWRLVVAARSLTPHRRALLAELAAKVRAGTPLAAEETVVANRIVAQMREAALVEETLSALRSRPGFTEAPGPLVNLGRALTPEEERVARILVAEFPDRQVVHLAEAEISGVRTGDFLVGRELVEAYSPTTASIGKLLSHVEAKHGQAGTIVINTTLSGVAAADVVASMPRLWGKPTLFDVGSIIVVEGEEIVARELRPAGALATAADAGGALVRPSAAAGAHVDDDR